jgi:hypothetical protein
MMRKTSVKMMLCSYTGSNFLMKIENGTKYFQPPSIADNTFTTPSIKPHSADHPNLSRHELRSTDLHFQILWPIFLELQALMHLSNDYGFTDS